MRSAQGEADAAPGELTADALAVALEQSDCASVLVVFADYETRARRLTNGYGKPALKVAVDPARAPGEWELF